MPRTTFRVLSRGGQSRVVMNRSVSLHILFRPNPSWPLIIYRLFYGINFFLDSHHLFSQELLESRSSEGFTYKIQELVLHYCRTHGATLPSTSLRRVSSLKLLYPSICYYHITSLPLFCFLDPSHPFVHPFVELYSPRSSN
ncbi:hypothetical protein PNOK_0016100 [Pyrrhoderma noxium]|uniref:Uncharacterized protein n=1 Tax=Pyrrhoderma noxium TaxID=2282107 RepID=A0A286UU62_9AGAM|nr:hypothetical protein PNOK_0016100 [Pyrrhoderma noxium]